MATIQKAGSVRPRAKREATRPTPTRAARWSRPMTGWPRPESRPCVKVAGVMPPMGWWASAGVAAARPARVRARRRVLGRIGAVIVLSVGRLWFESVELPRTEPNDEGHSTTVTVGTPRPTDPIEAKADGRSPGSRVDAFRAAFPGLSPSGIWSEGSPLTVAGAAAVSHRIPFSPRCRGTVGSMLN